MTNLSLSLVFIPVSLSSTPHPSHRLIFHLIVFAFDNVCSRTFYWFSQFQSHSKVTPSLPPNSLSKWFTLPLDFTHIPDISITTCHLIILFILLFSTSFINSSCCLSHRVQGSFHKVTIKIPLHFFVEVLSLLCLCNYIFGKVLSLFMLYVIIVVLVVKATIIRCFNTTPKHTFNVFWNHTYENHIKII